MLGIKDLAKLRQRAGQASHLSVYVAGTETDPAELNAWRRRAEATICSMGT